MLEKEKEQTQFKNPQEELVYLREKLSQLETASLENKEETEKRFLEDLKEYQKEPAEKSLSEDFQASPADIEYLAHSVSSAKESSDKIVSLMEMVEEKGIKNTLSVVTKLEDPNVEDDFHAHLVKYVRSRGNLKGMKDKGRIKRALNMTLFEVLLPEFKSSDGREKTLKELLSRMEQFYAGMMSVSKDSANLKDHIVIEIANPNKSHDFVFYVSVPNSKRDLFEKQILSIFPDTRLIERPDDYNVFAEGGFSIGSVMKSARNPVYPIKTYEHFDHDPLNVILNSFSKIKRDGEGAAIQLVFNPVGNFYMKKFEKALDDLKKGMPTKKALDIPLSAGAEIMKGFQEMFFSPTKKEDAHSGEIDKEAVELVRQKISAPIVACNVRIVASAQNKFDAEKIISDIESSFNQFGNTYGNSLIFKRTSGPKARKLFENFSFRFYRDGEVVPLNLKEITTLIHFQTTTAHSTPQFRRSQSSIAPSPLNIDETGIVLGKNLYRGQETSVRISNEDRLRHFYVIGQTGTGKSTLLKNMIVQDIKRGEGLCMIDPHGADIEDVLSNVPSERMDDVIYFDPSFVERPMGLNMLEYDKTKPEQKTFVVNELFSIFQKLYGSVPESMGPMFEQYFRNATMLVIEDPESGSTLLDVSRVLSDKSFREMKLSRCRNPVVVQFWQEVAAKAGGEAALQNIVPYVTSKFDVFLANDIMRPIIAQEHSAFNFRNLMDEKKILLVNLSKGRLGDINSNLIGLIIVGKILMAALSRSGTSFAEMPAFYLYIDEFQNVTTPSISVILSEARKYKLSLNIAHQFIAQLDEKIKNSVFGNVGSLAAFRTGSDDAEYLKNLFVPTFSAQDITNLENRNAYIKMLIDGRPAKPFNITTLPPEDGNPNIVEDIKRRSRTKYGRDRSEIEAEIMKRYSG